MFLQNVRPRVDQTFTSTKFAVFATSYRGDDLRRDSQFNAFPWRTLAQSKA